MGSKMREAWQQADILYREGQQTGVVTKALLKKVPCSVISFFTAGWTSSEPSFTSWSSVKM